jgi:hypothetical protein
MIHFNYVLIKKIIMFAEYILTIFIQLYFLIAPTMNFLVDLVFIMLFPLTFSSDGLFFIYIFFFMNE